MLGRTSLRGSARALSARARQLTPQAYERDVGASCTDSRSHCCIRMLARMRVAGCGSCRRHHRWRCLPEAVPGRWHHGPDGRHDGWQVGLRPAGRRHHHRPEVPARFLPRLRAKQSFASQRRERAPRVGRPFYFSLPIWVAASSAGSRSTGSPRIPSSAAYGRRTHSAHAVSTSGARRPCTARECV